MTIMMITIVFFVLKHFIESNNKNMIMLHYYNHSLDQ